MTKHLTVVTLVAFLFLSTVRVFADDHPDDYSMKIEIVEPANPSADARNQPGRANIDDGQSVRAFDFTCACDAQVERLPEGRYYPARWLEPQKTLRLRVEIGLRGDFQECDLATTAREGVYSIRGGSLTLVPPQEIERLRAAARSVEREISDRSGYPVTLFVLNGNAADAPPRVMGLPTGSFRGFGQGDIFGSGPAHGVDFRYECIAPLVPGRRYPSRWLEPQERLEVLIPAADGSNRYYPCEVSTEVRPELYVRATLP